MCFICDRVKKIEKFSSSDDYLDCLGYIQKLVNSKDFRFTQISCPTSMVYDERGFWVDDILIHIIRCNNCGQKFICECDTYHGRGSFGKL